MGSQDWWFDIPDAKSRFKSLLFGGSHDFYCRCLGGRIKWSNDLQIFIDFIEARVVVWHTPAWFPTAQFNLPGLELLWNTKVTSEPSEISNKTTSYVKSLWTSHEVPKQCRYKCRHFRNVGSCLVDFSLRWIGVPWFLEWKRWCGGTCQNEKSWKSWIESFICMRCVIYLCLYMNSWEI